MRKKILIITLSCGLALSFSCSSFNHNRVILMTWEEYYSQSRRDPYVFELNTSKGKLLYYGVFHTVNSSSPHLIEIEEKWKRFQPTIALSEGGIWPLEKSRNKAIRLHGEQGLLRYLASRDRVVIKSIEPGIIREAVHLLRKFPPKLIKVFFVLRQAAVNQMMKKNPNDISYVKYILWKLSKANKFFRCSPRTLAEFEEIVYRLFPGLKNWRNVPLSWFCSEKSTRWTNQMCRIVNNFRNKMMVKSLLRELKKGERVFAVAGRSHVVMQEPALRLTLATRKFSHWRKN